MRDTTEEQVYRLPHQPAQEPQMFLCIWDSAALHPESHTSIDQSDIQEVLRIEADLSTMLTYI